MVLLTSATVSFLISSSVIGLFTVLLFLSGYVLQQRSVRNIQAAIRPRDIATGDIWSPYPAQAAHLVAVNGKGNIVPGDDLRITVPGGDEGLKKIAKRFGDAQEQSPLDAEGAISGESLAYLQVLSKPSALDICSTILFYNTLSLNSSVPSQHVVLYPESWELNSPTKSIASALRLLRESSSSDHNVVLHAIDVRSKNGGSPSELQLFRAASAELARYKSIMYVRTPGLLLEVEKLDDLFLSGVSSSSSASSGGVEEKETELTSPWEPARLSVFDSDLPSAFLVTSQVLPSGFSAVSSHRLKPSLENMFIDTAITSIRKVQDPAYVYFGRHMNDRRERDSWYYQHWMKELQLACDGIDVSY